MWDSSTSCQVVDDCEVPGGMATANLLLALYQTVPSALSDLWMSSTTAKDQGWSWGLLSRRGDHEVAFSP
jgi:hypothetical protein